MAASETQRVIAAAREATEANHRGIHSLARQVRRYWSPPGEPAPGDEAFAAAAAYLALLGDRQAWNVSGIPGGSAVVVTTFDRDELGPSLRRNHGPNTRPRIGIATPHRLRSIVRSGRAALRDRARGEGLIE